MRIVLADIKGGDGFTSKDTVAGGYGSRLRPFSRMTGLVASVKRRLHDIPSVHLGYAAALATAAGHQVCVSRGELIEGDTAIVLSSLVDYRRETSWARAMRARGVRVGFIGLAAQQLPQLFAADADFIINGEPEAALQRLMSGERLSGVVPSPAIKDLDSLPFPQWEPQIGRRRIRVPFAARSVGGSVPVLASRSCPEFCTYCPHRIQSPHRSRSVANILDELSYLQETRGPMHIIFRDPLFSQERDRVLALCDGMWGRHLNHTFECETRLDRLDASLLTTMHRVGLRALSFGVEAVSPETLRRVGRRPIPESHQRAMLASCRKLGIVTAAFYVIGFSEDTVDSINATIDYAVDLGSTVAQFKILTPYPGTPLYGRMKSSITETDWEKFDGFTPTFEHRNLTRHEMLKLLGSAYTRFYVRPSFVTNYLRISAPALLTLSAVFDVQVRRWHARREEVLLHQVVPC